MTNVVIDNAVLDPCIRGAMNRDALVEGLVYRYAFDVLAFDLAKQMPVQRVTTRQVDLTRTEILDALDVLGGTLHDHGVSAESIVHTVSVTLNRDIAVEKSDLSADLGIPRGAVAAVGHSFAAMVKLQRPVERDCSTRNRCNGELFSFLPVKAG